MNYQELVSSLEFEALEHSGERVGDLLDQAAEANTAFHNRASELEADIEDLMQELGTIKAARLPY